MSQRLPVKIILLTLIVALAVPSLAEARRHRFWFWWWFRPPVEPVADLTTFDPVDVTGGRFYNYEVSGNALQGVLRTELLDTTTTASVEADQITLGAIATADSGGTTTVEVSLPNPATLHENVFGSKFFTEGTATVTENGVPAELDVLVCGRIHESSETPGVYELRGKIRGYAVVDGGDGTVDYKFVRFSFAGTSTPPAAP